MLEKSPYVTLKHFLKRAYLFPVEANTMIDRALPAATFSNEIVLLKLPLYYNQTM